MDTIVRPVKLDEKFEYEIEKQGNLYIAGIKKVHLDQDANPVGQLFLDALSRTHEKRRDHFLARPIFPNPGYNPEYVEIIEKKRKIFSVGCVVIEKSLDGFVENIRRELLKQNRLSLSSDDGKYFFENIHKHYITQY